MNEQIAKRYFLGIVFCVMIVGIGIGVALGSPPFLVFDNFDGLVIVLIGMVVIFVLQYKFVKLGYKIRIVKEGDKDG
jgi:hypothetical protein